jgi:hypothetical protein
VKKLKGVIEIQRDRETDKMTRDCEKPKTKRKQNKRNLKKLKETEIN